MWVWFSSKPCPSPAQRTEGRERQTDVRANPPPPALPRAVLPSPFSFREEGRGGLGEKLQSGTAAAQLNGEGFRPARPTGATGSRSPRRGRGRPPQDRVCTWSHGASRGERLRRAQRAGKSLRRWVELSRPSDGRGQRTDPWPQYAFKVSMFNVSCNSH